MQNPPILRDGLENADLFPMSGPASWCFLIPPILQKKRKKVAHLSVSKLGAVWRSLLTYTQKATPPMYM